MVLKKLIKKFIDINSEINEDVESNKEKREKPLMDPGFKFLKKTSLDYTDEGAFKNCYNHIWVRD